MFRSNNVAARVFERQIFTPAPGTSVHRARRFYENIVPSHTIYDIECPDLLFRKFSDDGQYLITFSRNHQDLIVYRTTWLSFSCKDHYCDAQDLPSKASKFESFFTRLYSVTLASTGELICKDFFLYTERNQFGIFATSSAQIHDAPAVGGAVQGVPSIEKITFHLVRLEDGVILDERIFCNDYINLAHSMGVFLYDDLLAVLSLRYQRIHIIQIRDSGIFVDVRAIGEFCREDDELFLNSSAQYMTKSSVNGANQDDTHGNGLQQVQIQEVSFLSGLKQRLLSFIVQGIWNEEDDPTLKMVYGTTGYVAQGVKMVSKLNRAMYGLKQSPRTWYDKIQQRMQCLKKKFYFHFPDYVDLIIWKVQFLDHHHLLIKFGSVDGGVARNAENHPAFFAVYNMETTEIVAFYQNSADDFYSLFELFFDHFYSSSKNSFLVKFISTHSNNIHALEQLRCNKDKANSLPQFVKKMLATLPISCQSQSPSPYFDHSLFRYDEKLISAADRHRQSTDHPIKFISRRQPNILKFKIKPGPESGSADARAKKISSFLFHPTLPLVISVQQSLILQPAVVNIHFRR